jgi:hypothetical protein
MSKGKSLSLTEDAKQDFAFRSDNRAEPQPIHQSSFATRIIKVPRYRSRRHCSSERMVSVSLFYVHIHISYSI